jgi:hypothetical protein
VTPQFLAVGEADCQYIAGMGRGLVVGAFDRAAADDDEVALRVDGGGGFDVQGGLDVPFDLAGRGFDADQAAVGVVVEALADDEELAALGERGGGEEGLEVLSLEGVELPELAAVLVEAEERAEHRGDVLDGGTCEDFAGRGVDGGGGEYHAIGGRITPERLDPAGLVRMGFALDQGESEGGPVRLDG